MPENDHSEFKSALQKAAALCSSREQCSSHIREKLYVWKISGDDVEKIISLLYRDQFLDDARYANFFVRDKFRFNGWGKIKLTYMLRKKQIPETIIKEALHQIDQEEYMQKCEALIKEKSATLKETNPFKRKGKLFRYAAQRGFESDLIHQILSYI